MHTHVAPPAADHVGANGASAPRPGAMRASSPHHRDPPSRHGHRARDFGVGYGESSGYGSTLHFIDGHVDPPFRVR